MKKFLLNKIFENGPETFFGLWSFPAVWSLVLQDRR